MALVSICIVTFNSPTLDMCLETLIRAVKEISHEIFVVDNNSTHHNPQELQHKYPQVKFIFNKENAGFARANNQAIENASGDFIIIMNPDIILEKNTIPELANYMIRHKHVKIAAPKLLNSDGSLQSSCRRFPTPLVSILRRLPFLLFRKKIQEYEMLDCDHEYPQKVDWASGAFFILRGKQYFDPRYFLYFEDVDLCRTAGEVHYVPSAVATHLARCESNKLSIAFVHHTASMLKYYWKWGYR